MAENQAKQADRDEERGSVPLLDFLADAIAGVASDRSIAAIGREAIKDIRETVMETFFGDPERGGEIGAPLNPLASEIANDNVLHAMTVQESGQSVPSPSQIVDGNGQGQERQSQAVERPSPSQIAEGAYEQAQLGEWTDRIRGEREEGGNDQNERGKGRSLPDEEREKEQERGRGQERDQGRGGRC